jgi:hypothetical protein
MNDTPKKQAFITKQHALNRAGTLEEFVSSVLCLASEASFVSGTGSLRWWRFNRTTMIP